MHSSRPLPRSCRCCPWLRRRQRFRRRPLARTPNPKPARTRPCKVSDVPFREPSWWYGPRPGFAARALTPAAWIYGQLSARRMAQDPRYSAALPVVCIGNFTAGGTGKTPLSLWIARQLTAQNLSPVFLTRVAGAKALTGQGIAGDVILMDDGLQNPGLSKDLTIAVVDGARAFGNGGVIPSGPLRAPLPVQLAKTDIVVVNGRREDRDRVAVQIAPWFSGPVLSAEPEPAGDTSWLQGQRILAFAGIGNPDRFFRLLERLGATLVGERRFADHHAFTDAEAARLLAEADKFGAMLVTTEKDFVRLGNTGAQADLKRAARMLPIALSLRADDGAILMARTAGTITERMS
ncbi:MAG: tetraacyldisaccharide 4'-kinase [Hyphomicrobium sp. 32-62-53]|nr:MAG: tetraacyldisaccharide 4'-kinase [Hyphomicrobium sp. 32-62-53]